VLTDLWSNKTRTLLVVCSIFIGVFAAGMIISSQHVLDHQLRAEYLASNPAHITVSVGATGYSADFTINTATSDTPGFDEDLVESIRHMREVSAIEGQRIFTARMRAGANRWETLQFMAIDDYENMQVNMVNPVRGMWPPPDDTVLIERSGMSVTPGEIGDTIMVELSDGTLREMTIGGVVHDLHQWPTPFLGTVYAYVNMDTLEWLGEPRQFNQLQIRVAEPEPTQAHNQEVAQEVYDKIQKAGIEPSFPQVPEPGEAPLEFVITALTSLMGMLSLLAILLSGFLVFNTIGALLAQQMKQIGIMKAVGARSSQIVAMYLVLVMCFGLLALLPAIPLARAATGVFTAFIAEFLNFNAGEARMPPYAIAAQVGISLAVPVLASLVPVLSGTRVTIREALSNQVGGGGYGSGIIDRMVQRVRGLSRPLLLALRNTFRRKGRLALTLITLTIGGAIFISVFNIRSSLLVTMEDVIYRLYSFDAEVYLERPYRSDYLVTQAERVPGVVAAEAQVLTTVRRVHSDDSEGLKMQLFAVPPDTQTMDPNIIEGRWLLPEDENALVISTGVLDEDLDLQVGSEVTLKIDDRETTWHVVGLMPSIGMTRWVYASYDYYGRVAHDVGETSYVRVVADQHTPAYQAEIASAVEEHYKNLGINVSYTKTMTELSQGDMESIQVIVMSLMFMAILVALVGGLGLAGTMSLNVIERVREIGIMRAIGASDGAVLRIFIAEGVLIGAISWLLGVVASLPISKVMSDGLGQLLLSSPLSFTFSVVGVLVWLGIAVLLSAVASYLPARNATQVSVREVLAYE
jgi:putative ABC transport system permease protein